MNLPLPPLSCPEPAPSPVPAPVLSPPAAPGDEARRLEALRGLGVLDGPPDPELDRLTRLATRLFGVPVALVSLLDADREWFFSRHGIDLEGMERALSFCPHAIGQRGDFVIEDARLDPRFRDNPVVLAWPRIRFYAGHPLYSRSGQALGTLCIIADEPRHFSAGERRALADLAALAEQRLQRIELERHSREHGQDSLRLEYALRESERRYMALFNNRTHGIMHLRMVLDAAGEACDYVIEAVNEAYERIMGRQRQHLEGRRVTEAFPGIERHPDFDFLQPYASVALGGGDARFHRYFAPMGRWFDVYAYSPAFGECITIFTDISAEKAAAAALQEREAALRATFEQAAIGIAHVGPSGRFLRANRAFCEMLGYDEAALAALHFNDITPAEDHEAGLSTFHRAMAGELDSFTLEKRYRRRDGEIIWGRITVSAVREAAGAPTLYNLVMVEDITARKLAEVERERLLREREIAVAVANRSRAKLQAVFDSIEEGIAVFDADGNLVLLNEALARSNRFASVEELQRHLGWFHRLYELRDAEGQLLPLAQWPVARVMRGERLSGLELQVTRLDVGFTACINYSGMPIFDESGRQVLSVLVNRDVTARRALEQEVRAAQRDLEKRVRERTAELEAANQALRRERERSRRVLEAATDAYIAADEAGRIVDWNPAAERLFGWSADEVLGRELVETLVPMRHQADAFAHAGEPTGEGRGREFMARHCDGHEFPVEISLSANRSGSDWAVSAFLRDISARKEAEAALRQAHDELAQSLAAEQEAARAAGAAQQRAEAAMRAAEAANRAKSEFLATMSHEIRTPLNGVIGFTGLLLDGPLTDDKRSYAELARRSGESLLHLLNDFLDFSKIEAGRLELEPVDFDPRLEASDALGLVRDVAQRKQLRLELDVQAPPRLRGDAARLRQVLLNLLSNAVKFTESGRVALRCAEARREGETAWLCFEVEDTGIGIDASVRERLFQPFCQADASTTRRFGGTGLGLAISKRLAEAMGGQIGVESVLGQGSVFRVELPFTRVAGEAGEVAPADGERVMRRPAPPRGRVLVVEDNPVSQLMLAEMLKRMGCRVDVAGNGLEAVEAMRRLPYDLIFMDCDMPIMNGFDATRAIRAEERGRRRVPIVAVTASALKGDSERCMAVGMDDFMSKPFRLQDMARRVETWLGKGEAAPAGTQG